LCGIEYARSLDDRGDKMAKSCKILEMIYAVSNVGASQSELHIKLSLSRTVTHSLLLDMISPSMMKALHVVSRKTNRFLKFDP
jgi:hypothetical protein